MERQRNAWEKNHVSWEENEIYDRLLRKIPKFSIAERIDFG